MMTSRKSILLILPITLLACNSGESQRDATGVFEATEIVVSSEANGRLMEFNIEEGIEFKKGSRIGLIDTTNWRCKGNYSKPINWPFYLTNQI